MERRLGRAAVALEPAALEPAALEPVVIECDERVLVPATIAMWLRRLQACIAMVTGRYSYNEQQPGGSRPVDGSRPVGGSRSVGCASSTTVRVCAGGVAPSARALAPSLCWLTTSPDWCSLIIGHAIETEDPGIREEPDTKHTFVAGSRAMGDEPIASGDELLTLTGSNVVTTPTSFRRELDARSRAGRLLPRRWSFMRVLWPLTSVATAGFHERTWPWDVQLRRTVLPSTVYSNIWEVVPRSGMTDPLRPKMQRWSLLPKTCPSARSEMLLMTEAVFFMRLSMRPCATSPEEPCVQTGR